jgi:hypothetical protein
MAESSEEYQVRVLGYLNNRDPFRVLVATPGKLERLIRGTSHKILGRRPSPGKWSIGEIIAHLADGELAWGWRLRNIISTPGVHLQWWDENLWAEKCHYAQIPVNNSLLAFRVIRHGNLALLRSVDRTKWKHLYGVHEKFGQQSLQDVLELTAGHDLNHILQIERLLTHKRVARK